MYIMRGSYCEIRQFNYAIMHFFRPAMKTGSSLILIALAVADSLVLVVVLTETLLSEGFELDITEMNTFLCKSYRYVGAVVDYLAVYYLVIFTIFRVISVYVPHKNNVYCTRKRALIAVTITCIIVCLINVHFLTLRLFPIYDESSNLIGNNCGFTGKLLHFYQYHEEYMTLCVIVLIPFCMIITGNLMIIKKMYQFHTKRQEMTQTTNHSTDDSQSMTTMLISISLLFFVTQIPFNITNLLEKGMNYEDVSLQYEARFILLETVTRLLTFVNNVANFSCYCVSGKRFKSELVVMIKEWIQIKDSPMVIH